MTIARALLLALLCGSTAACESGWDIRGTVLTSGVTNKQRPLNLYYLDAPTLDPVTLPAESWRYHVISLDKTVPAAKTPFSHSEFGCHQGAVRVVAWAPQHALPDPGPYGEAGGVFAPMPGDLVAATEVRHPYCGLETKYEEFTLEITDANTKK